MPNIYQILPELEGDEMIFVQGVIKDLSDNQAQQFGTIYRARRKDPQLILLTTLIGFVGVAGVQRFIVNQMGMGILYVLTAGLCFIGTIVDLVNYKSIAFQYNHRVAQEVSIMVKGMT
ncbi:MAG: NINE protein [Bacteroidota bacterium]